VKSLLSTGFDVQKINALPRMTAVPVAVTAAVLHNSELRDQESLASMSTMYARCSWLQISLAAER